MKGLAVCDSFVIVVLLLGYSIEAWNIPSLEMDPILYPLGNISYMGSLSMTMLLSRERYMAVCQKQILTVKKTRTYMGILAVFTILYCLPTFWQLKWETIDGNTVSKVTDLACNKIFRLAYLLVLNFSFRFLLPTICLITFNFLVYKEVTN